MKKFNITVNGVVYEVEVEEISAASESVASEKKIAKPEVKLSPKNEDLNKKTIPEKQPEPKPAVKTNSGSAGSTVIKCPMPGTILKINAVQGQSVKRGDILCILEAMKMENEIIAPNDAVVVTVNTNKGASVNAGDLLFTLN